MVEILNESLKDKLIRSSRILDCFDTPDLEFRLFGFDQGEVISSRLPAETYMQFVLAGSLQIYAPYENGQVWMLARTSGMLFLGDLEFSGEKTLPFVIEALQPGYLLALDLNLYKAQLEKDCRFLRFALKSTAQKMEKMYYSQLHPESLQERLTAILENECSNQSFKGVEEMASRLRCSRRQLQRVLKDLCLSQVLEKTGKGEYRLRR
ncbi:MAG: hypothetical protein HUJ54_06980 [Erysipelotrichaceae bacterium]|nr:hypothetical protein [Erysipelotrichaceae bacterium]